MHRIILCCLAVAAALVVGSAPLSALDANGPSWLPRETVATGVSVSSGADRVLAFDHFGNPGIAFHDGTNDDLRYARRVPGAGWVSAAVDSTSTVGSYPSLAYDRYERPAIAYCDSTNTAVKFAYYDGAAWNVQTVDAVGIVGYYAHLAFDLYGHAAIAYQDATNRTLKYVEDTNGNMSFADETPVMVPRSASQYPGYYPSLAFDKLNRPMIAHYDANDDNLLFSVREPGIGWVTTTVDSNGDTGYYLSLAINPRTGYPAIAFQRPGGPKALGFAQWDGNAWDVRNVRAGAYFYDVSLAFDPADGNPAISYYLGSLTLSWFDGNDWHWQSTGYGGEYTSLAFNDYGDGWPAIASISGGTLSYLEDPPGVPEPATGAALMAGAAALLARRRACARKPTYQSGFPWHLK